MKAVIYNTNTGEVIRTLDGPPGHHENQNLGEDEALLTEEEYDGEVGVPGGKKVDTSTTPPSIADAPDLAVPEDIEERERKEAFRDARAAGDVQGQLDVLFEVLTGEEP